MMKDSRIHKFVGDQLSRWPLACDNFRALKNVRIRQMNIGGLDVKLQFNPARMISSAAKLTKEDIAARRCFLCRENRPSEQIMIKFEGRKGKKYHILVNPYPIFPDHLVIAMNKHTEQSIWKRYVDMLDLARKYSSTTFFYNGPRSGASAPDHHHFQGAPQGLIPLECDVNTQLSALKGVAAECVTQNMKPSQVSGCSPNTGAENKVGECGIRDVESGENVLFEVASLQDAELYHYRRFTTGVFVVRSDSAKSAAKLFYRLLDCADIPEGESEPLINLFTYFKDGEYRSIVVFRSRHRSHHYFSDGADHLTMSPGCADMGGVFIVPVESEFESITDRLLTEMVEEVSIAKSEENLIIKRLVRKQPNLEVGIMTGKEIDFEILSDGAGLRRAVLREGKIEYDGTLYDELYFEAPTLSTMFAEPSFVLQGVTIGKDFHWQRKEEQTFAGALKIVVAEGQLLAVNVIGVEDYLLSVISSEMKSSASEEFLKAHAVISRSWVMARIGASVAGRKVDVPSYVYNVPSLMTDLCAEADYVSQKSGHEVVEYVKWYDNEQHRYFDVCADDHCQRYQGLTRATGTTVRKAIDATWGQILTYQGKLCDTRFSKCCGGVSECFSVCWEDADHPYLQALSDTPGHQSGGRVFCDTSDQEVLSQILNSYDLETKDFMNWKVTYSKEEVTELVNRKSGIEVGTVNAVVPVEAGESGRIFKLKISGSKKVLIVGKELEIRRILSESHLKSSAFEVVYLKNGEISDSSDWTHIVFEGRGWGHGVGLCQIGAAVMASEGYGYESILSHYYPGSTLSESL